jgi:hypothetical protein
VQEDATIWASVPKKGGNVSAIATLGVFLRPSETENDVPDDIRERIAGLYPDWLLTALVVNRASSRVIERAL